jgi:hypothetical protein
MAVVCASAAVTQVPANANLQQYLNAANPGDTLVLPAGASYTGNFVLPVKAPNLGTNADYITIITAGFSQSSSAQRVSPSNAAAMAKIIDPGNGLPAFQAPVYSHYWRLVGLEIFPATPQTAIYDLIDVGSYGSDQDTLDKAPQHFVFDQCYIHGWPNVNFKRGIAINGGDISVTNSYMSDFHSDFQEAQALDCGNGPGPFHIINNYLEGAAENILFGSPPSIAGLVPTGIEIRQNHFYKPLSLKTGDPSNTGYTPWIKNFIEFKNGQDIVIDGNLMENNWVQAPAGNAQLGQAIVLGPRTGGTDYDVVVQRVSITNNVIRHVGGVITMAGVDDTGAQHIPSNHITFSNNLVDDIRNDYAYPGVGSLAISVLGVSNVVVDHNDLFYPAQVSYLVVSPADGQFTFTNNIFPFGVGLNSPCGWKADAVACMFPDGTISHNVAVGAVADWMPAGTFEPASMNQVGFVNLAGGPSDYHNYALSASSPYRGAATDGSNIGVNFANIDTALTTQPGPKRLRFVPVTPCRIADTRNANGAFGGPELSGGNTRDFSVPGSSCGVPATAAAYSLNVTVVPDARLGYLTVWPSGQLQPAVSTLNSDGRVKANAAIVPAGNNGAISVFATDSTQVILDINGYFEPDGTSASELQFYPMAPCRIADTRQGSGPFGAPFLSGGATRSFPMQTSSCNIPAAAQAYSLNFTAVPHGPLGYITAWPTGQNKPLISTLNASTGKVTANAAIVSTGTAGGVSVYASNDTDLLIDINGYFAPAGLGGLDLFTVAPCRVLDTRNPAGSSPFSGMIVTNVGGGSCLPQGSGAQAFVLNATAVPPGPLGFLTLWPDTQAQPLVSTLNAPDGAITSNMAIVPVTNGSIDAFTSDPAQLILDISGYFAP